MNYELAEKVISGIDDRHIAESIQYVEKNKRPFTRTMKYTKRIVACLGVMFVLSILALSSAVAAGVIPAYDILYYVNPELAQHLVPVNLSCTDNGIEIKVEAVCVRGSVAEVYVSVRDLEGDRINDTADLFDCRIHMPGEYLMGRSLFYYDEENKMATFMITVNQFGEEITSKNMTLSVSKLLSKKQEIEGNWRVDFPVENQGEIHWKRPGFPDLKS